MNINPEPEDNEAIAPDFSLGTSADLMMVHIPVFKIPPLLAPRADTILSRLHLGQVVTTGDVGRSTAR